MNSYEESLIKLNLQLFANDEGGEKTEEPTPEETPEPTPEERLMIPGKRVRLPRARRYLLQHRCLLFSFA